MKLVLCLLAFFGILILGSKGLKFKSNDINACYSYSYLFSGLQETNDNCYGNEYDTEYCCCTVNEVARG